VEAGARRVTLGAGAASDAAAIRAEIQRQAGLGTDLVKMWADACSGNQLECEPTFTRAQMQAAAAEAHRLGKPIAIHAYHDNPAHDAVLAGADSVEHPATLAAMGHGAMHIGRAHELGAIAPGYRADLVAIAGDPLADIEHLIHGVCAVMKDGAIAVTHASDRCTER
jgi:imidazolonepropionase-like amidohydrolase